MDRSDVEPALAALDRDGDHSTYQDLLEASRCLVALRAILIVERRRGALVDDTLDWLNAIISHVVAAEYPLAGIRRERVESARRGLSILHDIEIAQYGTERFAARPEIVRLQLGPPGGIDNSSIRSLLIQSIKLVSGWVFCN